MRYLTEESIDNIAIGAAILGTGGGGDPYIGKLMAKAAIKKYGPIKLVTLDEIDDNDLVVPVSGMGAPTVSLEKIPSEIELMAPIEKLEEVLNRSVDIVMPIEIGGINSLVPIIVAAKKNVPMLDADAMGRAFPEAHMVSFHLFGHQPSPVTMADSKGNCAVLYPVDADSYEGLARSLTVEMGGSASICDYSLLGKYVKEAAIPNTLTIAEEIGEMLSTDRSNAKEGIEKMLNKLKGYKLFEGKITDIKRELDGGFTKGYAYFDGLNEYEGQYSVGFQNEHLMAKKEDEVICMTPDLIAILDLETGLPITTERIRYGARVMVVAFPCHEVWRTEIGIKTAGPRCFGYDIDYTPIEELQK